MSVAVGTWRQGGLIGRGKETSTVFDPQLAVDQARALRQARRDNVSSIRAGVLDPENEAALIFEMLRDQRMSGGILPSGVNGIYPGETPIDRLANGAVIYTAGDRFEPKTGESTTEIMHRWEVGDTDLRDIPFEVIEGLLGVAAITHAPMFLAGLAAPLGLDALKATLSGKTLERARDLAWLDVTPRLVKLVNGITALAVAASGMGVGGGVVKKLAEGDQSTLDNSHQSPDGKPPIKALGFLAAASAFLTACREWLAGQTPQPPTVEVTQVTVTPEPSKTPTPTETPVPPTPEVFLGVSSIDQISAVPGIPAGFGGPGGQELVVRNTVEFQARLNESGFAPVVNEEGAVASILSLDGDRLCVGNTPEKLFNPNAAGGEDTLLRTEAGVFQFGDAATGEVRVRVLSAVPLNGLPDNLTCVEAVVVDPNNPAGLGALRMLLVDRNTQTIVGEMPAAFPGSDTVEIIWTDDAPMVRVNGDELYFQFRPEFVTATPEPTAINTPVPTESSADRAQRFCEENKEAIATYFGREFLGKFIKPDTYYYDGSNDFLMVFDGNFDLQLIPLTTKAGEKFGDAIMSMNACYQDRDGHPKTILLPLVTHLADGRLVAWSRSDLGAYSRSDATEEVADMAEYLSSHGWVRGAVIAGDFALDTGKYYLNSRHRYDDWYRPTVEAAQMEREAEIKKFLASEGEFNLSFMIPVNVGVDIAFKIPGLR